MGKRSRHKSRHTRTDPVGAQLAHIMRTHCTECAAPVEWLTADDATHRGIDLSSAVAFLGEAAEVWACTRCDNYGVMGPTEHTGLVWL